MKFFKSLFSCVESTLFALLGFFSYNSCIDLFEKTYSYWRKKWEVIKQEVKDIINQRRR